MTRDIEACKAESWVEVTYQAVCQSEMSNAKTYMRYESFDKKDMPSLSDWLDGIEENGHNVIEIRQPIEVQR